MSVLDGLSSTETLHWIAALVVVRATAALLLAAGLLVLLRRASAAVRHAVLGLTVAVLLGLPLLSSVLPHWELGVLPTAPTMERPALGPGRSMPEALRVVSPPAAVQPAGVREELITSAEPSTATRQAMREPSAGSSPDVRAWPGVSWLLLVWLAGIATGLAQLLLAVFLVRRTSRGATAVTDPEWRGALAQASAQLGLTRRVRLLSSPAVGVPVVYGYWHAVVLLPQKATAWPEDRRRAFLLHELAHVARHDCLTQTLAHVARLVYWPNPLAWWQVRRLRAEAERACDDRVLAAGTPASDYALHLLDAARDLSRARRPLAVLAVVERSHLEDRLLALLDPGLRRGALTGRSLVFGAALSLVVACSVAALQPVARVVARTTAALVRRPSTEVGPAARVPPPRTSAVGRRDVARTERPFERSVNDASVPLPEVEAGASAAPAHLLAGEALARTDAPAAALPVATFVVQDPRAPAPLDHALPTSASPGPANRNVPIIRISTDLIQIDAVVTDKAGQPVVDLKAEDFDVFESGQRQRVSHLVYVSTGHGAKSGGDAVIAVPPESLAPRTALVVVDDLGLTLDGAVAAHNALVTLARNGLSAFDRVGIITTSARGRVDLTWDREAFAQAAAAVRYKVWRGEIVSSRVRKMDAVGVLRASVDALRTAPGRKAVIFLSDSFYSLASQHRDLPVHDYAFRLPDTVYEDSGVRAAMNSLIDLANRASVVIYTIDAAIGALPNREENLIELAEDTGGLAIYGQNDIGRALEHVLSDHAGYYLIGYEPRASTFAPGAVAFHEVKVRVKRPGLNVRSRKGFYGLSDEQFAQAALPAD